MFITIFNYTHVNDLVCHHDGHGNCDPEQDYVQHLTLKLDHLATGEKLRNRCPLSFQKNLLNQRKIYYFYFYIYAFVGIIQYILFLKTGVNCNYLKCNNKSMFIMQPLYFTLLPFRCVHLWKIPRIFAKCKNGRAEFSLLIFEMTAAQPVIIVVL